MPQDQELTGARPDFGNLLWKILGHATSRRAFRWPIHVAVIDSEGGMMLQTIQAEGGCVVHYPERPAGLAFHMAFSLPAHLLLVDGRGRAFMTTITQTGEWLGG
jgi:hypothetical protein